MRGVVWAAPSVLRQSAPQTLGEQELVSYIYSVWVSLAFIKRTKTKQKQLGVVKHGKNYEKYIEWYLYSFLVNQIKTDKTV